MMTACLTQLEPQQGRAQEVKGVKVEWEGVWARAHGLRKYEQVVMGGWGKVEEGGQSQSLCGAHGHIQHGAVGGEWCRVQVRARVAAWGGGGSTPGQQLEAGLPGPICTTALGCHHHRGPRE